MRFAIKAYRVYRISGLSGGSRQRQTPVMSITVIISSISTPIPAAAAAAVTRWAA
jgi:hypothetical protein